MTFGEALMFVMKEKGISTTELEARSGVNKQTITELLKGRSKEPKFTSAKKLANGLGVPLELFVQLTDDDGHK